MLQIIFKTGNIIGEHKKIKKNHGISMEGFNPQFVKMMVLSSKHPETHCVSKSSHECLVMKIVKTRIENMWKGCHNFATKITLPFFNVSLYIF